MLSTNFSGKFALITGAANGIGREIAIQLHKCGANIIALDINQKELNNLQNEINCQTIVCDLSNVNDIRKAHRACEGKIHMLVNCAGIAKFENYFDGDFAMFDKTFSINVKAIALLTQLISGDMVTSGIAGSIVHISSQSSVLSMPNHLTYSTSKAAVDSLARIQAMELGKYGIRVNTVNPTVVLTKLAINAWDPKALEQIKTKIPLRRVAKPIDVAKPVIFLLSDNASMITGTSLFVDGGYTHSKL